MRRLAPGLWHGSAMHGGIGVRVFAHGARLPGGVLALGDCVIRAGSKLSFVPDQYMGPRPEAVKKGLQASLARLA
ncbi:MAG: hypothetical protein KGL74_06450, partial [Elusimicrobia bacterium]|nr:hypothetical protein [Elusimicrobiota bacterium]